MTDNERAAALERSIDLHYTKPPRTAQGGMAARAAIRRAQALACLVRDEDVTAIGEYLDQLDGDGLYALVVTLAAMVDPDVDVAEDRLGWLDPIGRALERAQDANRKRRTAA